MVLQIKQLRAYEKNKIRVFTIPAFKKELENRYHLYLIYLSRFIFFDPYKLLFNIIQNALPKIKVVQKKTIRFCSIYTHTDLNQKQPAFFLRYNSQFIHNFMTDESYNLALQ